LSLHNLNETLGYEVFMKGHGAGIACLDNCLGREPHDVKVTARSDIMPRN
jgi:hypothetical protein